jgi:drug/metabolite transporter (DMT)-like permease
VASGWRTGRWPSRETYAWGAGLGIVNYASADFFLRAVAWAGDDAAFVFPANSVAIVIGAALVGTLVWGERLSRANVAGLAVAAVALVLLGQ